MADRSTFEKRVGGWLSGASDALVSVFFPGGCRLCERLLLRASPVPICQECLGSFALGGAGCERCGQPLATWSLSGAEEARTAEGLLCPECRARTYGFDRTRSYALYKGAIVPAIMLLKFESVEPLGRWFAERLVEVTRREAISADVVVPVPLHRQRQRERGYNQAELVAKPLARKLGLPYRAVLLTRTKPRPDKHILSLEERWDSVRGAFATRPGSKVDNLRVLLVDDVMTTGATLDACAKALRGAGAKSVIGLTVARAARHPAVGSGESNPKDAQ
ncbi:MAG: putative phosphoribosyltransferase [Candidatus Acidoferrum typicum]|nr:putative phosphoribosyltransferase [Candidatus Acidoferrum typicum]